MNLKNTLLMAALGLIMSAYSVQTTHAQVVTVQVAKASSTPISSLPSNIVAPGTYALTRNLNYPAGQTIPAIVIANNLTGAVVVDLKGFTIASSGDLSFGVNIGYYNVPASNAFPITIRNGTLTNFSVAIDASQGGHDGLTNITLDHLTITHPLGAGVQTTAIYLPTTASTVSYCNLRSYEFGIRTNRTGSVANNSYKNNTFALVDSPFFFENNDFINTDPIVLDIQTVTEHLQFPQ
jgi:hypothetical protein